MMGFGDSEMQQREQALEDANLRAAQEDMRPDDLAKLPRLVLDPRLVITFCVAVTKEAMQQVADIEVEAAGEADEFKDALLNRGLKMMGFGDSEMQQREQALEDANLRAAQADMPPDDLAGVSASGAGPHDY